MNDVSGNIILTFEKNAKTQKNIGYIYYWFVDMFQPKL